VVNCLPCDIYIKTPKHPPTKNIPSATSLFKHPLPSDFRHAFVCLTDKSTMAPSSEASSGDAGSGDYRSSTPDIHMEHFGQASSDRLFIDATTSHFYHDQPFELSLTDDTAIWDLPAENTFLNDQLVQLPVIDENASDMMLIDDDNALLHDPLFPPPMDDNTLLDMMPIDDDALCLGLYLQLPEFPDLMPVVNDVLYNHSSQLPVADATAFGIPPWAASGQAFSPDPPPPPLSQDGPWPLGDQVPSAEYPDRCFSPLPTTIGIPDLLGLPTTQLFAVVPGVSAHPPAVTNLPLNALGSPQPLRQEEGRIQARASMTRKRSFDQAQSPIRPGKRLSTIRPKPLPVQPSSAGRMSTMTSNASLRIDAKQANVPADMLTTFKVKGSGINNSPNQRTRSTKVCLRCRTLRQRVSLVWMQ
jgi:hypothetical protein